MRKSPRWTDRRPACHTACGLTARAILVAAAVAAVLAFVLYPYGCFLPAGLARRSAAQMHAAQIAKAYAVNFIAGGEASRPDQAPPKAHGQGSLPLVARSIDDVAFVLARYGQLNDARVWFDAHDPQLRGEIPAQVIEGDMAAALNVSPAFKAAGPKAWAFVIGLPPTAPPTTPLLWTYGLQPDGKWAENSPWKGEGGIIAFRDTHVVWLNKVDPTFPDVMAQLFPYPGNPNRAKPIVNIFEAIPHAGPMRAQVLNASGQGN